MSVARYFNDGIGKFGITAAPSCPIAAGHTTRPVVYDGVDAIHQLV
jgi:hypothetical protein